MNSWKFNSKASFFLKIVISKFFNIPDTDVYKKIKSIEIIKEKVLLKTSENEIYKITLKKI